MLALGSKSPKCVICPLSGRLMRSRIWPFKISASRPGGLSVRVASDRAAKSDQVSEELTAGTTYG